MTTKKESLEKLKNLEALLKKECEHLQDMVFGRNGSPEEFLLTNVDYNLERIKLISYDIILEKRGRI